MVKRISTCCREATEKVFDRVTVPVVNQIPHCSNGDIRYGMHNITRFVLTSY